MRYLFLLLSIICFISCNQNNTSTNTNQPISDYTNACCCNTIFNVGIGKIFVPSMFTPNADGINDQFRIYGDSNIKYITNLIILNSANNAIATIDTMFSSNTIKYWNGKLSNNSIYEGNFSCTFNVIDKANSSTAFTGNGASYIKTTHASSLISNYANCKFEDQFDIATFLLPYITNDNNFH